MGRGFLLAQYPTSKLLEAYATHFTTVELDTTFYGVPRLSTIAGWRERPRPSSLAVGERQG